MRIGLLGHGWWSRKYLVPALVGAGAEIAAVCGRDAGRAAAAAADLGVDQSFDRLETMLDTVSLDALAIVSPPSSHLDGVLAAAGRGLAVFCEKPLARTAAETARMVEECRDVPSVVGFTQRWHPAVRTAYRLVSSGAIGEVRHLRYASSSSLSAFAGSPWDWRYDAREYSYGILSDLGPHAVDLVQWLTGSEITAVTANATTVVPERTAADGTVRRVENWDDCTISARLSCGASASLVLSRVLPVSPYHRFHHQLEIVGTQGSLTYSSDRPAEVVLAVAGGEPDVLPPDDFRVGDAAPGSFEELMAVMDAGARRQAQDTLAVFRGEPHTVVPTLLEGHRGQIVLDAAAASVAAQSWVSCPDPLAVRAD